MNINRTTQLLRTSLAGALLAAAIVGAHAQRAAPPDNALDIALSNQKVVMTAGKESLEPAAKSSPGDVIQYSAAYKNISAGGLTQIAATLPIPRNTTYVGGSAQPALQMASLDGVKYELVPLKRVIKDPATGVDKTVEVPLSEYRSLRWNLASIPPGKIENVMARVRIDTTDAALPLAPARK